MDVWTEAGAPVFAPMDGKIHSFQNNAGFGNYGPTIILEHTLEERKIFTLYGHLFQKDLANLQTGKEFKAGDLLCHVGPFPENGDWPPHLHFQVMWDLGEHWGIIPEWQRRKSWIFIEKIVRIQI
ncbi:peptidoglycan DD-metalloendopeptidase family protein [Algoriphagus boritolerans]|uniref:peptidoglycan DD-metalloendopeptidase family protein n=1 Tax=Algoriphagus boritolerans TaxID=308111 RepID=UPI000A8883BB